MTNYTAYKAELRDTLEKYSEGPLFRDWNDGRVHRALLQLEDDLVALHASHQPPLYRLIGKA